MTPTRTRYQQVTFRIILGFAACSTLLFAVTHPQVSYLGLLAISAVFRQQSVHRVEHWLRRFAPIKMFASIGILAVIANLVTGTAASAQWAGAQTAANTALSTYIGADIVKSPIHRCLSAAVLFDYRWPDDLGLQGFSQRRCCRTDDCLYRWHRHFCGRRSVFKAVL